MKTTTATLGNQHLSRWYSEKPFAYRTREEMGKRMQIGISFGVSFYALVIMAYFVSTMNTEVEIKPEKKKLLEINVQQFEIPKPPDVRNSEVEAVDAKSLGTAIAEHLKEEGQLSKAENREALKMAIGLAVETSLNQAISDIASALGDAIPVPSEDSKGGLLAEMSVGALTLSPKAEKFASILDIEDFKSLVSNRGTGLGEAERNRDNRSGLSRNTEGIGKRGLRIAIRPAKPVVKENLRPADEIAKVIAKHQTAFQDLYARYASEDKGTMTVRFVISSEGVVTQVGILKRGFKKNDAFERNLLDMMKRMKFSSIQMTASQSVEVPFNFTEE